MHRLRSLNRTQQVFALCLLVTLASSLTAFFVQNDFGRVEVRIVTILDENGLTVTGKLYRPVAATEGSPAPAVLLLHGMNNDKDTEGPAALELARRGIVALALDQTGHGDSETGAPLLELYLGGAGTLGANASYQYLKSLAFVDATRTGLVGHSMGAMVARLLARTNPDHRAVVIQAGGPANLTEEDYMHNYLNVWPLYEELFYKGDRASFLANGLTQIAQNEGLAPGVDGQVDHTYGSFAAGTAHRYALCYCTHPGTTWNAKGVAEICAWMLQALSDESESEAWSKSDISTQTYMVREGAMLLSLVVGVLSLIPLGFMMLRLPYFKIISAPIPQRVVNRGVSWWKVAMVNAAIGGLTFIVLPMIGMILGILVGSFLPVFKLVTGNGALLWLFTNAVIAWLVFRRWFRKAKAEQGVTMADLGAFEKKKSPEEMEILKRTVILTGVLFVYLYLVVTLSQSYLGIEFRYMWPQLKILTPTRFAQFLLYLLPILPFFLYNGGLILFGMLRQPELNKPWKTQMVWWVRNVIAMESGLAVVIMLQYAPMALLGTPPLMDFTGLFGLYGIFLMAILPVFAGLFFVMTAFYMRTGRIYLGAFIGCALEVWILAAGSLMM